MHDFKYKRYLHDKIDFTQKLIGLIGERGSGKTTFLLQYLKEHQLPFSKKLYFSADSISLYSLFDIAYEFSKSGGKNKSFKQIKDIPNSYVVSDNIEIGNVIKFLFGCLGSYIKVI